MPISRPSVVDDLWSDHKAISFTIPGRIICQFLSVRHDYTMADWDFYRRSLVDQRRNFVVPASENEIDAAIITIQQDIIRDLGVATATFRTIPWL